MMAALMHRQRTGQGQVVDTSLLRSSAHLMNYFYGEYWAKGVIRKAMGTANHLSVPNQVFPTADGSVVIIAPSDEMWRRCAAALDAERLDRPEWSTILDRQRHRAEVIEAVTQVTLGLSSDEVMDRLGKAKVNVAKVNNIGQAADHPQLAAAGGVIEFDVGRGRSEGRVVAVRAARRACPARPGTAEARRAYATRFWPSWALPATRSRRCARRGRSGRKARPSLRAPHSSIRKEPPMKLENVKLDVRDFIATVTLARPPVNATSRAMRGEITQVFDAMTDRDDVRVVILTAEGKTFCAGADIKERTQLTGEPGEYGALNRLVREMFYSIMECPKPVIAAVNGAALGAGMALDLVLRHHPRERGRDLRHAGGRRRVSRAA